MRAKLTKRIIDATETADDDRFLWDTEVRGFGLKCTPRGRKVYLLQARLRNRLRRWTIGPHGSPWTPDGARREAIKMLGAIAQGHDPLRSNQTNGNSVSMAQLCDLYLREGCSTKKGSTVEVDRGRIERHIKPLLGTRELADITRAEIERFMTDVADGKSAIDTKTRARGRSRVTGGRGTATRCMGLLGAILSFAVARNLRADNPARGIRRYKDRRVERYLTGDELARLSAALELAHGNGINPFAIAAIKLLLFTGMRRSEILTLRHDWIDFERGLIRLPDSKSGAKTVPVGTVPLALLRELPRVAGNPHVIASSAGAHFKGLQKIWKKIRADAKLNDVRLHDLRHHFISVGAASGESLYILGKVVGHRQASTTQRYAHLSDHPVRASADRISSLIMQSIQRQL